MPILHYRYCDFRLFYSEELHVYYRYRFGERKIFQEFNM